MRPLAGHGRKLLGITGALALTCAIFGGATPAMAAEAGTHRYPTGGLETDPSLTYIPGRALKSSRVLKANAPVPTAVDLSAFAPTPGDQGYNGACASWGTGYTMMGWWARKAGDTTKTFAPMYLYSQVHVDDTADGGGSTPASNYRTLIAQGITKSSDWSGDNYNFSHTPNDAETAAAAEYKTGAYHTLFYSGRAQSGVGSIATSTIKQTLANGYPVGIGIPIYDAFYSLNQSDSTYMLSDPNSTVGYEGGHYVVAVGYNATGVIIENSWGTGWGDRGFATLGWDFIESRALEAEYMDGPLTYTTGVRAPGSATNLTATATADTSVNLAWSAPADTGSTPLSSYTLTATGNGVSSSAQLTGDATTATVSNLTPDTDYTFSLTPTNTLNASGTAATLTAHTATAQVVQPTPTTQPTTPVVDPSPVATTAPVDTPTTAPTAPATSNEPVVVPDPVVSHAPIPTPSPVVSDTPVVVPSPVVSHEPVVVPSPVVSRAPVVIPDPVVSHEPVVVPSPVVSREPVVQPAPAQSNPGNPSVPVISEPAAPIKTTPVKAPTFAKVAATASKTNIKLAWSAARANTGSITKYTVAITTKVQVKTKVKVHGKVSYITKTVTKTVVSKSLKANARSLNLTKLKGKTSYSIKVSAFNSGGKAVSKTYTVKTR